MDVARSFTYMLKQPGGIGKLVIGAVLLLIPIVGWALVAGYGLRVLRAISAGDETLPEWSEWGDIFVKGLLVWVIAIAYDLPGLVLSRFGGAGTFLSSIWGVVVFIALPAALLRFANRGNLGAAFEFTAIIDFIRTNSADYVVALALGIVAGFIGGLGFIVLIIGGLFTMSWAMLAWAHLMGSVYRESGEAAGSLVPRA